MRAHLKKRNSMEVAQILSNIGLIDLIQAFEGMKGMSRQSMQNGHPFMIIKLIQRQALTN